LEARFAAARSSRTVKGFAVGRTIFAESAKAWLAGTMTDEEAVADMARKFGALVEVWERLGDSKAA
ncbi:MAG: 2-deoxy-5-keto-D-gluconate 6-phosphate aldolase domain-containing protein, partial [Ferrovibrio sp.]